MNFNLNACQVVRHHGTYTCKLACTHFYYISPEGMRVTLTHNNSLTLLFTHVPALLHTRMHTHIHRHLSNPPHKAPSGKTGDLWPLCDMKTCPDVSPHTWPLIIRTCCPDSQVQQTEGKVPEGKTQSVQSLLLSYWLFSWLADYPAD